MKVRTKNENSLTALAPAINKDLTTPTRKHGNELETHEKTLKTAIKEDLKPDLNHTSLDYDLWGILENKSNATTHPNIGSLKTAIEEEWNKMSEEFILKACKSFRMRVDKKIEKMVTITIKFTDLCLSYFQFNLVL